MAALVGVGMVTVLVSREPDDNVEREQEDNRRRKEYENLAGAATPSSIKTVGLWLYSAVVAPFLEFLTRPGCGRHSALCAALQVRRRARWHHDDAVYPEDRLLENRARRNRQGLWLRRDHGGRLLGGYLIRVVGILKGLWICGICRRCRT